jgi:hypothetical protein
VFEMQREIQTSLAFYLCSSEKLRWTILVMLGMESAENLSLEEQDDLSGMSISAHYELLRVRGSRR